ncbi:Glyoxylase, beta-lactamase superfamily II [Melghirimyces thermohalophilus]|uniref:Glyoxylase, beta-lactamase superfamily II n=1 Tax=Melghirimyces thermohalophilus TaxID=1236220 RepID=A0A1G6L9I1_9BACL|nr:MBL fold metallo-hydrolase [Melghirimyces thermohalophilus]SDC39979.1 Glyoxylase, beta-lactamase superfamily II [Melghirimyces thermohalophilus]
MSIKTITVEKLQDKIADGENLLILDVRNPEDFQNWKIEGKNVQNLNIPYFDFLDNEKAAESHLSKETEVVVVCVKGGSSEMVAEMLADQGYDVFSLEGGMQAWGDFYTFQPVVEDSDISLYQGIRPARGCLSYVIASRDEAIIVDPLRHIDRYLQFVKEKGLKVVSVLDTHGHADHISGGPALAKELDVPYYLHPYDGIHPIDMLPAGISYEMVQPNQEFKVGSTRIKALHIPGHTLGNITYLINDRYLLSGDSIFLQSIARPDLGGKGETWAPVHYESLKRLLELPDETVVLPGHFSSPHEADENGLYTGTLGELKQSNDGLRKVQEGKEAFVQYILSSLPTFPPQYVDIKRVNAGLLQADEDKASELELGRNICALSQAYDD